MTDQLFQNMMNKIENKMKLSFPYFIKKEIERNSEYLDATFTFRMHQKIEIVIDYNEEIDVFSINLYLDEEEPDIPPLTELETTYITIKKELINQLRDIPSYRLQMLYAEEKVLEDYIKVKLKFWM